MSGRTLAPSSEKRIDHLLNAFIYERDLQWLRDARVSLGLPPTLAAYVAVLPTPRPTLTGERRW